MTTPTARTFDLTICQDCTQAIANDDYSGLDNHPASAAGRRGAIRDGITAWNTEGFILAATGGDAGFEATPCDCCNDWRAGNRTHAAATN